MPHTFYLKGLNMKQMNKWLTAVKIGILGVTFASGSVTVNAQNLDANTCVQVAPQDGIYVHQKPSVYGEALAILLLGENVTVASDINDGWVAISSPIQGYVYADDLTLCDAEANVSFNNCRQVTELTGVNVLETNVLDSFVVGQVAYGNKVKVEDVNIEGWLLLVEPIKGYVPEDNLSYCK